MKYIHTAIALLLASLSVIAVPALASNQSAVELKPVMIIRFNQDTVYFEQQLSMVVSRAKAIKADVTYDLIQYIPVTQSRSRLVEFGKNGNSVVDSLTRNGVPPSQIRFMQTSTPDVPTDEVYIFVR